MGNMEIQKALVSSSQLDRTLRLELRLEPMFPQMNHFQSPSRNFLPSHGFSSGALPSILHLDHELIPKVRRKHQPVLGERERKKESGAAAPWGLHTKEHPEASAHGPGHIIKGQVETGICHTGSLS